MTFARTNMAATYGTPYSALSRVTVHNSRIESSTKNEGQDTHAEWTNVHLGLLSLFPLRVHWFVFWFLPQPFTRFFQFLCYLLRSCEFLSLRFFTIFFRKEIVQISHAAMTYAVHAWLFVGQVFFTETRGAASARNDRRHRCCCPHGLVLAGSQAITLKSIEFPNTDSTFPRADLHRKKYAKKS